MKLASNKVALAVGAGVIATGAVAASAASLGSISSAGIGTSTAAVSGCQSGSLTVAWDAPTYSATGPKYTVSGLTLGGIAAACQNKPMKLTVAQSDGTALAAATNSTTTAASATTAVTLASAVDTAQIGNVTVTMVYDPPWDQSRMSDEARVALDWY